jgi:hypothetical protein
MEHYFGQVWLVRLLVQRGLAAVYLIAFVVAANQFKPLLGERGLLPATDFLEGTGFWDAPSIFHWRYSDRLLDAVTRTGILISSAALLGFSEAGPFWLSATAWLVLWALYLSIVNVGQTFYAFGWESMILEAGFFTAFMGPARLEPSLIPVLILRWMLFRTEFGAGLIKVRHDPCWRELTCLFWHYQTQPLPNRLSWYFHRLPNMMHKFSVLFSHFVQLIVPFGLFAPQPFASIAGGLIIFHQLWLIVSGNYSWLNWLTVILGITAFSDSVLSAALPIHIVETIPRSASVNALLYVVGVAVIPLSIQPTLNFLSRNQLMNYSYNHFHLVNVYGAFGSVTKTRYEIIIEGTDALSVSDQTTWQEYGFRAKPGDPRRIPPQIAPYHLRLDWLMWFLPFSVAVTNRGIQLPGYEIWFVRLIQRLLEGDRAVLCLLKHNPFPNRPPRFIRALFYLYRYTDWREKRETSAWWTRRVIDVYMRPISLAELTRL